MPKNGEIATYELKIKISPDDACESANEVLFKDGNFETGTPNTFSAEMLTHYNRGNDLTEEQAITMQEVLAIYRGQLDGIAKERLIFLYDHFGKMQKFFNTAIMRGSDQIIRNVDGIPVIENLMDLVASITSGCWNNIDAVFSRGRADLEERLKTPRDLAQELSEKSAT